MEILSMLEKLLTLTSGLLIMMLDKNSAYKESNLKNLLLKMPVLHALLVNLYVDVTVSP